MRPIAAVVILSIIAMSIAIAATLWLPDHITTHPTYREWQGGKR